MALGVSGWGNKPVDLGFDDVRDARDVILGVFGGFCRDWTRTIFLRGQDEDYTMTTKARLLERLRVIVAGRAAEELEFGVASTYSINDLAVRSSPPF